MRQSTLFSKTRKQAPADEVAKNAELLIKAGFIHKEMAGVYSYLPLGLRVLNKISDVIRDEMNSIGGQELFLTVLQDKETWSTTNRWSEEVVDSWFKTKLKSGTELGLGFTHEEPLTKLMKDHIQSYKDLPVYVYQIQTKFRNEPRAKSGLMRGREFLMKDFYSFSKDEKSHVEFYEKAKGAYKKIFERVGLGGRTHLTFASGGTFSKYSHEFQTVTEAGEDTIHICSSCGTAINEEIFAEQNVCPVCNGKEFRTEKAVEVGNIFNLGSRFSEAFDLSYLDESGQKKLVVMGSYGIGPGRLMGTIVEALSDEKGMVWPKNVAPFEYHLLDLSGGNEKVKAFAEDLYGTLSAAGHEVLYDDRPARAGEKFADADLFGIPTRLVISEKTIGEGKIERKERTSDTPALVTKAELVG
ncbi:MAG: aminoacyl--tRNA ligase-related protein [bacterium]|nr:aminoacyl--tRNA ligase-related protein [bacterium]